MSTEKDSGDGSDSSVQASWSVKNPEKWHLGRAVAYRAVYGFKGSNHRKDRGNNDAAKISPSRLSKVSLATALFFMQVVGPNGAHNRFKVIWVCPNQPIHKK
ncbi:unnamed protein product [Sphenostylis stenocarpa]|uniref:Uncharacterized protein n=1 Tax=Sphenostylis stenocarpa TaxID=92480 RepID=A0AA86TBD7_9FABA|nr:unnamed protein product [Sphenostylis stenocarpa]